MKFNIIYQNKSNSESPKNRYYIVDHTFQNKLHNTDNYWWLCGKNYSTRYKFDLKMARYVIENYKIFADKHQDGRTFCFDFKIIPDGIKYYEQHRL